MSCGFDLGALVVIGGFVLPCVFSWCLFGFAGFDACYGCVCVVLRYFVFCFGFGLPVILVILMFCFGCRLA